MNTTARFNKSHAASQHALAFITFLIALIFSCPANAQAGCLEELSIDVYGPNGSVMAIVSIPQNATFSADMVYRRMLYTAGAIGLEVSLSPLRSDGFAEKRVYTDGFSSPYNTWVVGDNDGGTFNYTNTTTDTEFILELGYIATRTARQEDGLSAALKYFRINGGAACASAHVAPDKPTASLSCGTMPLVHVGGDDVFTEPFLMNRGDRIWMKVLDRLPQRYDDDGHAVPYGKWFEYQFGTRFTLQGSVGGQVWEDIRDTSRLSHSRSWGREAYLSSSFSLLYPTSSSTPDYNLFQLRIESTSSAPLDGSTQVVSAWISNDEQSELICLESTETTVDWDTHTSCAYDNTRQLRAFVTNKSTTTNNYRIKLFHPVSGAQIHASESHPVAPDKTEKISLGGIPAGRWLVRMFENDVPIGVAFHHDFKAEECVTRVEWALESSCADDNTLSIEAQVTNHSSHWADFRIRLLDPSTGAVIHSSRGHNIVSGQTRTVSLGGIPPGTWIALVYKNITTPVGNPKTVTFSADVGAANGLCDQPPQFKQCFDNTGANVLSPLAFTVAQRVLAPSIMEHSSVSASSMISGCNTIPDDGILIRGPEIFSEVRELIASADHEVIIQTFSWDSDSWAVSQIGRGLRDAEINLDFDEKLTVRLLGPADAFPQGRLPEGLENNPEWRTLDMDKFIFHYGIGGQFPANIHHDKMVIVDGIAMIITGANPQNNNNPGVAWYDVGVRINGPAVRAAIENFDHYWRKTPFFLPSLCSSLTDCQTQERVDAPLQRRWPQQLPSATGNQWTVALSRVNQGISTAGNDINNPQDEAWTSVFESAPPGSNISIITPNINDDVFRDNVVEATQRGVNVRILTGLGFNASVQALDGGRNCDIVTDLYQRTSSNLFIRWHTHDGQVVSGNGDFQTHAKFMAVTDTAGRGVLAIVGSGNHDTQSWDRSHEYNVLLDGQAVTDRLMLEAFTPVWNVAEPAGSDDCL